MRKIFILLLASVIFLSCDKENLQKDNPNCIQVKFITNACDEYVFQVLNPNAFPYTLADFSFNNNTHKNTFKSVIDTADISPLELIQSYSQTGKSLYIKVIDSNNVSNRICTINLGNPLLPRYSIAISKQCSTN